MLQEVIYELTKLIETNLEQLKKSRHLSENDVFRVELTEEAIRLLKDLDSPNTPRADIEAKLTRALILAHNAKMLGLNNEKKR